MDLSSLKRSRRRRGRGVWLVILLALLIYAFVYSNTKILTRKYSLSFSTLPPEYSGTRFAVIADCHGRFDSEIIESVHGVDMIFLVGDIIDDASQLDGAVAFAEKLATVAPVFLVTGNHEWSTGVVRDYLSAMRGAGVNVMDNETFSVADGFTIAGLTDHNGPADMASPATVLNGLDGFVILLSHRPYEYETYAELGADLIISGHIHGGLIRIPGVGGLIGPGHEFLPKTDGGVFESNGSSLVVSRGLAGVSHFPRLFNPREIVIVTLTKG